MSLNPHALVPEPPPLPPQEMLREAAKRGDEVAFASVYRLHRDALVPFYPRLEIVCMQSCASSCK